MRSCSGVPLAEYAEPGLSSGSGQHRELDTDPSTVFFTDDSTSKLHGAIEIGMTARRFQGVDLFRDHLAELGIR